MSPISEDDLDRLADYTAGVLDPQQAAEVDRLIAADPAWAQAYAELTAAGPWLDEALSGLLREPMPADVAALLERAVQTASRPGTGTVVPFPRRRWRRVALTTAAAVAVGAFVGQAVAILSALPEPQRRRRTALGGFLGLGVMIGLILLSARAS